MRIIKKMNNALGKHGFQIRRTNRELSFEKKLEHNYHELSDFERIRYHAKVRPKWDHKKRFYFEGDFRLRGQMYIADRKCLYETILEYSPSHCLEIGTYTGGGSTYFLAHAFKKIGKGKIYTLEIDTDLNDIASNFYKECLPELSPFVDFILGDSPDLLFERAGIKDQIECVFLDGAENAEQSLNQFMFFQSRFRSGSILMCHDWNTHKMRLLRPVLENSDEWMCQYVIGMPESVGFAVFIRR